LGLGLGLGMGLGLGLGLGEGEGYPSGRTFSKTSRRFISLVVIMKHALRAIFSALDGMMPCQPTAGGGEARCSRVCGVHARRSRAMRVRAAARPVQQSVLCPACVPCTCQPSEKPHLWKKASPKPRYSSGRKVIWMASTLVP